MITQPAKVFLPLAAVGVVAAVLYSALTADPAGTALFGAMAVAAFAAAVAVTVNRDNEFAPAVSADAGPPEVKPARPARLPGGPGWPVLAALGAGFGAVALIAGPLYAVPGAGLVVVAAAGWLASVTGDRTGRAPNLMPVGIPVVGLFAVFSLMFLMSRILLAVPEQASTAIALTVAALILAVASFVAVKPSIPPRALMAALVIGGLLMTGGGLVAAAAGQREVEKHEAGPKPVGLMAKGIRFSLTDISLVGGQPAAVNFKNEDDVPHNFAIYNNPDYAGLAVFQGAVITHTSTVYRFDAPPSGTYYFRCDIHPAMQGKVNVT